MYDFDKTYIKSDELLGGIDEAGRGPLAGPVVSACVLLPSTNLIKGLNDSKKLTEKQRCKLESEIKEIAIDWAVAFCPAKIIDNINILEATRLAMSVAYQRLKIKPQIVLIDAVKIKYFPIAHISLIKGDAKSAAIAAASILAKQARDRYMQELDEVFPNYGFKKHKGYPTGAHYEALRKFGHCSEHRLTFRGVIT